MKTALVHDWLISPVGGAEKCLEVISTLFPSPIYTLVHHRNALQGTYFQDLSITPSFLQKIPNIEKQYRKYLPLFPFAIERFNFEPFDLIISSSHCVAKGVVTSSKQLHVCYCHTPVRYAWDLMDDYLRDARLDRGLKGVLTKWLLHRLRSWDASSAKRVNHFIAVSKYVADRIQRYYSREATVIHPPVDLSYYSIQEQKQDYYLAASRFVPYKKMKLIVEAFSLMPNKKLVVIGDGPEWKQVEAIKGANIELLGYQPDAVLREHLQQAKGFVFAALEDFGIIPIEALGCGTPVIAFGKGAVRETIVDGVTGLFFEEQNVSSVINAVERFENMSWDPKACRKQAELFSKKRFETQFQQFIFDKYAEFSRRVVQ